MCGKMAHVRNPDALRPRRTPEIASECRIGNSWQWRDTGKQFAFRPRPQRTRHPARRSAKLCSTTSGQVRAQAAELEQMVRKRGWRRVALLVSRTDTMIGALAVCQKCGCDLLLLREDYPIRSAIWSTCQVEAVLDDNLEVIRSYSNSPSEHGGFVLLATSGTTGQPKVAVQLKVARFHDVRCF
jgi:non-ribosomal peptide synthetase component F